MTSDSSMIELSPPLTTADLYIEAPPAHRADMPTRKVAHAHPFGRVLSGCPACEPCVGAHCAVHRRDAAG